MYKFIKLTNGKDVQAFYEADESQVAKIAGSQFDFKDLTDGKIAQKIAFVDVNGNKVNILKLGPELHTNANAASDPNGNEADAVTGFLPAGSGFLFESQSVIKSTGSFALKADSTPSGTNGSRFYVDLDALPFNCVVGKKYKISFSSRHLGSGGEWKFLLNPTNILDVGTVLISLLNTDVIFSDTVFVFTHSLNTKYFGAREFSALSDGGVYLDNLSLKEVL